MKRTLVILLLLSAAALFGVDSVMTPAATEAGSALSHYLEGNKAYRDGDYGAAVEAYQKAIEAGAADHRVYYNLGNSYYRLGEIGEAVLNYERALRISPRYGDALSNLRFVKTTMVDVVEEKNGARRGVANVYENTPLGAFYDLLKRISQREFILALIISSGMGTILLILWILVRSRSRRWHFGLAVAFWSLFLIILVPFILKKTHEWESNQAVVVARSAEIRSAPTADSKLEYTFGEGMEVAALERRGDYYRVRLRNGEDGWVLADHIERVFPGE